MVYKGQQCIVIKCVTNICSLDYSLDCSYRYICIPCIALKELAISLPTQILCDLRLRYCCALLLMHHRELTKRTKMSSRSSLKMRHPRVYGNISPTDDIQNDVASIFSIATTLLPISNQSNIPANSSTMGYSSHFVSLITFSFAEY